MKWLIFSLFSAVVACNSASSEPPRAAATGIGSASADFSKYKTFSFAPANPPADGFQVTPRSLEVQRRLAPLVQTWLEKHGYVQADDKPELLVKLSSGSAALAGEKRQRGNPGEEQPAGAIGIDVYDSASGTAVWHGSGMAEIDPEVINDELLALGVEKMMAEFPSQRAQLGTNAP